MVNPEELAICRRRGHETFYRLVGDRLVGEGWKQCKWCGMWVREVHKIEEREDDPPEEQRSPFAKPLR
jgi:hypothetical protein